jgi:hypothetical protein
MTQILPPTDENARRRQPAPSSSAGELEVRTEADLTIVRKDPNTLAFYLGRSVKVALVGAAGIAFVLSIWDKLWPVLRSIMKLFGQ